jgi:hypothetical protein
MSALGQTPTSGTQYYMSASRPMADVAHLAGDFSNGPYAEKCQHRIDGDQYGPVAADVMKY